LTLKRLRLADGKLGRQPGEKKWLVAIGRLHLTLPSLEIGRGIPCRSFYVGAANLQSCTLSMTVLDIRHLAMPEITQHHPPVKFPASS